MRRLTLLALPLLGLATLAEARPSTPAEFQGYQTCRNELAAKSDGLSTERSYLVRKHRTHRQYVINAARWEDGERARVRMACETDHRGTSILASRIESGRYTHQNTRITIDVADRGH